MTRIIDASALGSFRASPESYRLRYCKNLRPRRGLDNQADAGAALHVALDLWFRGTTSDLPLARAGLKAAWGEPGLLEQKRPLELMEGVLTRYAAKWPRERDGFAVVANESYVEAEIQCSGKMPHTVCDGRGYIAEPDGDEGNCSCDGSGLVPQSFRYCGILDRKIAFPDGSQYVMDLKSTSAYLSDAYFRLLSQSDQMIGYVAMERALGRRCDGFFVDAVHIPRGASAANPFQRFGPVLVPDWRVKRWADDVKWTLGEIARLEEARGVDTPWPVHHNWGYGKPDSFFAFVEQPPELHAQLMAEFDVESWDPAAVAASRQEAKLLAKISQ